MAKRSRRYWAIRTDSGNRALLLGEVKQGKLRQGWGYEPGQDLRIIQGQIRKGGAWKDRLSEDQQEALPHLRMLADAEDSVQVGDWIVVPKLPDDGSFLVAEVVGPYSYEMLDLSREHDINDLKHDYGHVLPIRVLAGPISRYAKDVDAALRGSLRTPMRMWCLDPYGRAIERLVEQALHGADLSTATSGQDRLGAAWKLAWTHAEEVLRDRLGAELDTRFQAAEWEEPIKAAMEGLYPGSDVRWVGGPQEHGADVVVQIRNPFSGVPWLILVQVKNYSGEIGADVIKQLRIAYEHYSKEVQCSPSWS
jgi:hypothetical protein